MSEDALYKQAAEDIKRLVNDVKEQCEQFAEEYYYEKDWVFSRFREELNKSIRESK
ncbi:hypothetical protein [Clostridium botulinum]|uniref:hypothetical protein n=1 Tax=Clostridium botulinum TaxID=1491 RepID=UPI001C9A4739|nr:hypothetical protein [Clostridium botulinum]MBY6838763.1 hypothetical protein [Clostridium botulinum]